MIKKFFAINESPWVSSKTREWLENILTNEMVVFEYGSGSSTIFFARRVKRIISVEYQLFWFLGVLIALLRRRIWNFKLILARPEVKVTTNNKYASSDPVLQRFSFEKFVKTIDQYPDKYFDLIFIDGRARNDCIRHAVSKIKNGGYLLLDDSNREVYQKGLKLMAKHYSTSLDGAIAWKIGSFF